MCADGQTFISLVLFVCLLFFTLPADEFQLDSSGSQEPPDVSNEQQNGLFYSVRVGDRR